MPPSTASYQGKPVLLTVDSHDNFNRMAEPLKMPKPLPTLLLSQKGFHLLTTVAMAQQRVTFGGKMCHSFTYCFLIAPSVLLARSVHSGNTESGLHRRAAAHSQCQPHTAFSKKCPLKVCYLQYRNSVFLLDSFCGTGHC